MNDFSIKENAYKRILEELEPEDREKHMIQMLDYLRKFFKEDLF